MPLLRIGRSALWMAVAALILNGCGPANSSRPPEKVVSSPTVPKPVSVSPQGEYVAAGLDGLTLYDRYGRARVVADHQKNVSGTGADVTGQFANLKDVQLLVSWSPDETEALIAEAPNSTDQSTVWLFTPESKSAKQLITVDKLAEVHWLQSGKGTLQVSAGCCGPMNLFIDLASGRRIAENEFQSGGAFAPDARHFVYAPYIGASLTIRDLISATDKPFWGEVPPDDSPPQSDLQYRLLPGPWSADSRYFATVIETSGATAPISPTMRVIDVTDGKPVLTVRDWVPAMAWLPGGSGLLYATKTGPDLTVHLGSQVLSTHKGGSTLGIDYSLPIGVISPDNSRLSYAVSDGSGSTQLFIANLKTGQASAIKESADLSPLMWTGAGTQLLVSYSPNAVTRLPGGGETSGRHTARLQWISPPN